MKCVILQPSYIPWRGYFHQIYLADVFVFYDDVQYDKRGWRNRNRIKTHSGPRWLTIPVHSKGARTEQAPINRMRINWDQSWNSHHWQTLRQAYGKAPHFKQYAPLLESFYNQRQELLADFTIDLTVALAKTLGITGTEFMRSSSLEATGCKTERLLNLLRRLGASEYISGPAARAYLEEDQFRAAGITLTYMNYDYPAYPQLYPPYDPQVSILDLLFMTGDEASRYILTRSSA